MAGKKTVAKKVSTQTVVEQRAEAVASQAVTTAKGLSVDSILQDAAALGTKVNNRINEIAATAAKKLGELETINTAIDAKKAELAAFVGQEANLADVQEFERACEQKKLDADHALAEHVARCEEAMKVATTTAEANRQALEVARQREEDTYKYNRDKARRAEEDAWAKSVEDRKRAESLRQATLEREWAEKDATYVKQTMELTAQLVQNNKEHEEALKAAGAEKAVALNSLKKDMEHAAQLTAATNKTALELAKLENAGLVEKVKGLEATVAELRNALEKATARVETIATTALTASSGKTALDAVQQTIRDQQAAPPAKKLVV